MNRGRSVRVGSPSAIVSLRRLKCIRESEVPSKRPFWRDPGVGSQVEGHDAEDAKEGRVLGHARRRRRRRRRVRGRGVVEGGRDVRVNGGDPVGLRSHLSRTHHPPFENELEERRSPPESSFASGVSTLSRGVEWGATLLLKASEEAESGR